MTHLSKDSFYIFIVIILITNDDVTPFDCEFIILLYFVKLSSIAFVQLKLKVLSKDCFAISLKIFLNKVKPSCCHIQERVPLCFHTATSNFINQCSGKFNVILAIRKIFSSEKTLKKLHLLIKSKRRVSIDHGAYRLLFSKSFFDEVVLYKSFDIIIFLEVQFKSSDHELQKLRVE